MKLLVVHLIFASTLCLALVQTKSILSEDGTNKNGEPRIFFRQMIEASGLFPLEINVPDTLSSMMSGLSSAYDTMSMYFGSGGGQGNGVQSQSEATRDRKKKVKRKKKKKIVENDYDYDFLQYLML